MATELRELRKRAHDLLEELFPDKQRRYNWLSVSGPWSNGEIKIHCAQMVEHELVELIGRLEKLKLNHGKE